MPAPQVPTVMQLIRRRRRKRWSISLLVALILASLIWMDRQGWFLYQGDDLARYQGQSFTVKRIIDGDTIELDVPDGKKASTTIRLWGINAPEIAHPQFGKHEDQPFGPQATQLVRQLAMNQSVRLELQPHRLRDSFGRLLAYVDLPDGSSLNERLITTGLAVADNRPGDQRFVHDRMDRYAKLQQQAQKDRVGLWSNNPSNSPAKKSKSSRSTKATSQPASSPEAHTF